MRRSGKKEKKIQQQQVTRHRQSHNRMKIKQTQQAKQLPIKNSEKKELLVTSSVRDAADNIFIPLMPGLSHQNHLHHPKKMSCDMKGEIAWLPYCQEIKRQENYSFLTDKNWLFLRQVPPGLRG